MESMCPTLTEIGKQRSPQYFVMRMLQIRLVPVFWEWVHFGVYLEVFVSLGEGQKFMAKAKVCFQRALRGGRIGGFSTVSGG